MDYGGERKVLVGLWVVGGGIFMFDTGEEHKVSPEFGNKKLVAIRNNIKRQSIFTVPGVKENDGEFFRRQGRFRRYNTNIRI